MASILVIDDEPQVREVIRLVLEDLGHQVVEARGGREGLELYRENPADLVIADVFMPGKDGLQTLLDLRKLDPSAKILLVSGAWQRISVEAGHLAEHLGAVGVLQKPFDAETITRVVQGALALSE